MIIGTEQFKDICHKQESKYMEAYERLRRMRILSLDGIKQQVKSLQVKYEGTNFELVSDEDGWLYTGVEYRTNPRGELVYFFQEVVYDEDTYKVYKLPHGIPIDPSGREGLDWEAIKIFMFKHGIRKELQEKVKLEKFSRSV